MDFRQHWAAVAERLWPEGIVAEDESEILADDLELLAVRALGLDLQFRRAGTSWPRAWRARLVWTKNERSEYRIVEYADTPWEAVSQLRERVSSLDDG